MSYVPELVGLYEIRPFIIWPLEDGTFIKAVFDYLAGGEKKDAVIMRYGHINDWDLSNVDDGKIPNKWLGKIPLEDDTIHAAVNDYLEGDELIKKAVIIKYGKIEYWNVSKVTDMSHLFQNKTEFNESIGASGRRKGWNVSNVTKMSHMFDGATSFNQPIGSWDVSNVTDMSYMFKDAWNFNQFRGSPRWYTGNVTNMSHMFDGAKSFGSRQVGMRKVKKDSEYDSEDSDSYEYFESDESVFANISNWNVSSVTDMSYMFKDAWHFNGNIGGWTVRHGINMKCMFDGATSFKKTLCDGEKTWYHT